eukprot:CAMPEP_0175020118 /NCGR_PEP_ID=MMETSP0005-20121125/13948_1 /TAXON_ID=420556 /ORGANISM="Ochromonas sp., Strain CCMP1393" /LENGTH=369 /DNA_ID=CAMNT_0016277953 /DNA_START=57 /DNA_END=1167 /DNA_ORIENTATION=+
MKTKLAQKDRQASSSKGTKTSKPQTKTGIEPIIEEARWLNPVDGVIFFGDLNYRTDLPRLELELIHDRLKDITTCSGSRYNSSIHRGGDTSSGISSTLHKPLKNSADKHKISTQKQIKKQKNKRKAQRKLKSINQGNSIQTLDAMKRVLDTRYMKNLDADLISTPLSSAASASAAATATANSEASIESEGKTVREDLSSVREEVQQLLDYLLQHDQLHRQRGAGEVFDGFMEGSIEFPPSFKYDKHSDVFDSSAKQRWPAWTDRILYATTTTTATTTTATDSTSSTSSTSSTNSAGGSSTSKSRIDGGAEGSDSDGDSDIARGSVFGGVAGSTSRSKPAVRVLELHDYYSLDARTSDHRPVCADFTMNL